MLSEKCFNVGFFKGRRSDRKKSYDSIVCFNINKKVHLIKNKSGRHSFNSFLTLQSANKRALTRMRYLLIGPA